MGCQVFTYSPNNIYATQYYNACKNFDNIQSKVIAYERSTNDRTSEKYQKMIEEFDYWNYKVPELSNVAGREEERLAQKEAEKGNSNQQAQNYTSSPFYKDDRLDFLA